MHIFILRHGQAELQKTTDEVRNLTLKGRADVANIAVKSLADLQVVQQIWVSSLVRAQQTADIVASTLAQHAAPLPMKITDLLVPEADPYLLFEALQDSPMSSVLLVSHQPLVGKVIDLLCGSYPGNHPMNTSSLACVDCDIVAANRGKLRWLRHENE